MFAQVPQPLSVEVGGFMPRQSVITALTRTRHKIEKPGMRLPPEKAELLSDICTSLDLSSFEVIEVMGSSWAVDKLWELLTPTDAPFSDWLKWTKKHEGADLGQVLLAGDENASGN